MITIVKKRLCYSAAITALNIGSQRTYANPHNADTLDFGSGARLSVLIPVDLFPDKEILKSLPQIELSQINSKQATDSLYQKGVTTDLASSKIQVQEPTDSLDQKSVTTDLISSNIQVQDPGAKID